MRFGPWEIIIIVMFVVILFGAKRIPEIMRGLGSGFKEFKSGLQDGIPDNNSETINQTEKQSSKKEDTPKN